MLETLAAERAQHIAGETEPLNKQDWRMGATKGRAVQSCLIIEGDRKAHPPRQPGAEIPRLYPWDLRQLLTPIRSIPGLFLARKVLRAALDEIGYLGRGYGQAP